MSVDSTYHSAEAAILGRLITPETASLSPEAARAILKLDFQAEDRARMQLLSEKASAGTLSPDEQSESEGYAHVGHLLALLQSKARLSLNKAGQPT